MKQRGFEIVSKYKDQNITLPIRKTKYAAGYDIASASDIVVPIFKPGIKPTLVPTGLKGYCKKNEYFMLVSRSSGPKKGLIMPNSIGIIDHDYYNNEDNEGEFFFQFFNCSDHDITIHKGDMIGQVIFQTYLLVDDDIPANEIRKGGFGSTDSTLIK